MTFTLSKGYDDALRISFIQQTIPMHNVIKISVETNIIENEINIETLDHQHCLFLIEQIRGITNLEILINNEGNIIVLWY